MSQTQVTDWFLFKNDLVSSKQLKTAKFSNTKIRTNKRLIEYKINVLNIISEHFLENVQSLCFIIQCNLNFNDKHL